MKKVFSLKSEAKPQDRHVEGIKSEIKKYLARERRKKLPDDTVYWTFNCKFGDSVESAQPLFPNEIKDMVNTYVSSGKESFYLEIISEMKKKEKK